MCSAGLTSCNTAVITTTAVDADTTNNSSDAGVTVGAPKMDVQGNGNSIADGDTTPTTADDTDFGSTLVAGGQVIHTFTISNTGDADLNLTGTSNVTVTTDTHFSVSAQPGSSTIGSGNSATFQITFDPSTAGSFQDTVNISNNDADEDPYTFVISGTGTAPDLVIVKTVNPTTPVNPGDPITYTITFTNTGTALATGVVITDIVPVSVTNANVTNVGAVITPRGGTRYVWDVANLASDEGGVITITGQLSATLATGTFTNTAEIACAETEGDETNNSSDAPLTVQNVAPIADAGNNQTVLISTTVTLDGSGSSDPNGDTPTYGWAQAGGTLVTLSDSAAISPTFTAPSAADVLTFTLVVTDSHGLADPTPDEVVITVSGAANQPPVADAGSNQTVSTSDSVTLDGSASSDPDGHTPLTYGWAQTGGTAITLSDSAAISPTFTAPSTTGLLTFTLTVTDSHGLASTTPDEVLINVVSGDTSTPVDPATGGSLVYTGTQPGGTVTTTIDIPPGAITDTISLIYTEILSSTNDPPASFSFAGRTFALDAYLGTVLQVGYVFKTPITITLDYDPDAMEDVDEATLELHYWDGSQWTSDGIVVVERDTTNHRLVVTITHLTEFAMLGIEGAQHSTYLPMVANNYVAAPDLVVQSVTATSDGVQVVIENQGTAPMTGEFWVDVYVNPDPAPTAVNQIWPDLADEGLVWGVTAEMQPGDVITLTVGDAYYVTEWSTVSWPLDAGTSVWAQVDSWNADTTYGAVLESHEITGGVYNNISSTVSMAGLAGEPYRWW